MSSNGMSDEDMIKSWSIIDDPIEALRTLAANSVYIGSDPYYRHFDTALWGMVERVLTKHGHSDGAQSAQNGRHS